MDYKNKLIMAPMVKISTLPSRLLALEMGADLCYSEELIDFKLIRCVRKENKILNTIDFYDDEDVSVQVNSIKFNINQEFLVG
jgi:tRNA-dihydrouridine synthase 2